MVADPSASPLLAPLPADLPAELRERWEAASSPHERAYALLRISYFVEASSRWAALELAQQALNYAAQGDAPSLVVKVLLGLAFNLGNLGRIPEALENVNRALTITRTLGEEDRFLFYDALLARAALRCTLGDGAGARRDYLTVVDPVHGTRDPATLLLTHVHLIPLLVDAGQPEGALHHSRLAHEHLTDLMAQGREEARQHAAYYEMAVAESHLRALVSQAEWLQGRARQGARDEVIARAWAKLPKAAELAEQQSDRRVLLLHCHAANLARLAGDLTRAHREAQSAVEQHAALGRATLSEPYVTLGKVYLALQDRAGATAAYEAALAIARQSGQRQHQREVRRTLSLLYEERGDLRAALQVTRDALDAEQAAWSVATLLDLTGHGSAPESAAGDDLTWQEQLRLAEQQARTDPLTGLLNRRGLRQALEEWRGDLMAPEGAAAGPVAVALLDIDDFKRINDEHSHRVGDAVLRTIAHLLGRALPPDALLARYGGEEFLIVTRMSGEQARLLIERCRAAVGRHDWGQLLGGRRVTLSGGYALGSSEHFEDLVHEADEHLYRAKREGRDRLRP